MAQITVQSVDRVLDIIEAISRNQRPMALTELSDAVALHKTTTYRLLNSLAARGYVCKDENTGYYRLTMRLLEISSRALSGHNLLTLSVPVLEKLAATTQEVVHLVIRDQDEIAYLFKHDPSNSSVRMSSHVGMHNPMYCTAVGKSILAYLPDEEIAGIFSRSSIERFTDTTLTTLPALMQDVMATRKRGYAIDNEEHESGIRCIGATLFDYRQVPIGAISVSAPSTRMSDIHIQKTAPLVISAAHDISLRLGQPASTDLPI